MQRVFVIDQNKQPLMPCHPARARELLRKGRAAVFRRYPFTLILLDREGGDTQPVAFKIDPGSQQTGIALVGDFKLGKRLIWAAVLEHRGQQIKNDLENRKIIRRNRRHRHTRYRPARFSNRRRLVGWLPPSLQSRIENIWTWLCRISRAVPIDSISQELVKFDTQWLQNAEISGVEYQQGELVGYEVREYLLEKFNRQCIYCKAQDVPLEVEHITPRSRGGSNRVSNLTLACHACNQTKGNQTAAEFGHYQVQKQAKQPLKDAGVINATRWALFRRLETAGLPLEVGSGGRTKFNRAQQSYPKAHWIDAACVGESGAAVLIAPNHTILLIKAIGHGNRQMCGTDKFGFPSRHRTRNKLSFGFQTGDIVKGVVPAGKHKGTHIGRLTIRNRPSFKLNGFDVSPKHLTLIHHTDGYGYAK